MARGVGEGARTLDLLIKSQLLYLLSYTHIFFSLYVFIITYLELFVKHFFESFSNIFEFIFVVGMPNFIHLFVLRSDLDTISAEPIPQHKFGCVPNTYSLLTSFRTPLLSCIDILLTFYIYYIIYILICQVFFLIFFNRNLIQRNLDLKNHTL